MHTRWYSYEMWRVSLDTGEHLKSSCRASLGFLWLPSSYLANLKSKVFSLPTEIGYQMQFRLCLAKLFDIFYGVAFFPWCLVAAPCRIMSEQGNKRDAVWLGLSLFKWLCIMFKSFGRSAVLVPVRLPSFGGSLVESFLVPLSSLTYAVLAKRKLQQRQCRSAAETSLYLNINIIELFLSHGGGFWSQRLQPTAAATATGYKERWNLPKILTSCL